MILSNITTLQNFNIYILKTMKTLNIALVAHDARKKELIEWARFNAEFLAQHNLYATGTTGRLLQEMFDELGIKNKVTRLLSGPIGGDQMIGAMIAEGRVDVLVFFCDNLITQGHQQDVGALVRLASLHNVAFATNRTTADMIVTTPLATDETYERVIPSAIQSYVERKL